MQAGDDVVFGPGQAATRMRRRYAVPDRAKSIAARTDDVSTHDDGAFDGGVSRRKREQHPDGCHRRYALLLRDGKRQCPVQSAMALNVIGRTGRCAHARLYRMCVNGASTVERGVAVSRKSVVIARMARFAGDSPSASWNCPHRDRAVHERARQTGRNVRPTALRVRFEPADCGRPRKAKGRVLMMALRRIEESYRRLGREIP